MPASSTRVRSVVAAAGGTVAPASLTLGMLTAAGLAGQQVTNSRFGPMDTFAAAASTAPVTRSRATSIASVNSAVLAQPYRHSRRNVRDCFLIRSAAAFAGAVSMVAARKGWRQSSANHQRGSTCASAGMEDVGAVLLSGGVGKRMGAKIPKQYLKLLGLEIALYALDVFIECGVKEIAIVCAEEWRTVFQSHLEKKGGEQPVVKFALGGKERQDSVQNGLELITAEYAAIHDSARPLVTKEEVEKVVADAREYGAALLAVSTKATIKQATEGDKGEPVVAATPNRKTLWEAHTPQVIRSELLRKGFENAVANNLEVTDDVSLIEFLGEPVKLTEGEYTNIKVTTPEDIQVAETILRSRGVQEVAES